MTVSTNSVSRVTRNAKRNLSLVVAFFMLALGCTFYATYQYQQANRWTVHTHLVIEECQLALSSLQDVETGQRGFLLTNNPSFLEPYEKGVQSISSHVARIRDLTSDNPVQEANVKALEDVAKERVASISKTVEQQKNGLKWSIDELSEGKRHMDRFRLQADKVMNEENRLLREREKNLRDLQTLMVITIGVITLVGVGMLIWVAQTVQAFIASEEESKREVQRIATLLDVNQDPIIELDPAGKIIYWNKGAEATYGFSNTEAIGKAPNTLLGSAEVNTEVDEALKTENGWQGILERRTKDGRTIQVSTRWQKQPNQHILESDKDVTEQILNERRLQTLSTQLGRSNQDLQQFAYVASHDLQEPLRAVIGFLTLLDKRLSTKIEKDEAEWLAYAVDGAQRMRALVNGLLAFSRVDSQGQTAERPVDLNKVVKGALLNLGTIIEETQAEVKYDSLPEVIGDEAQLTQLFQNLIGNGIKYRKPSAIPVITVSARRETDRWVFSVDDNGIGFDPAHADRIFVIFQRLHTRSEYAGTGIGLALCKRIVERHSGEIWCTSEPDKGSTFFFSLPFKLDVIV